MPWAAPPCICPSTSSGLMTCRSRPPSHAAAAQCAPSRDQPRPLQLRPVGEGHVRGIEEVALFEAGCHAERQVVPEVRRGRDIREGHPFGITLHDGKLEAAAPLEDGADRLFCKLLAQMCDLSACPGVWHHAEDTVHR